MIARASGALVTIAAAGLVLSSCGSLSVSSAMTSWAKQSSYVENARTLLSDARHSATALRDPSSSHQVLNTVCQVLFTDAGSMQASLPTPDAQATSLVSRATDQLGGGASVCANEAPTPANRARALALLVQGAASLTEATARIATESLP